MYLARLFSTRLISRCSSSFFDHKILPVAANRSFVVGRRDFHSSTSCFSVEQYAFQAETKNFLDVLVNLQNSHSELFVRDFISNGSNALERRRIAEFAGAVADGPSEMRIKTLKSLRMVFFEDTGIGMDREELRTNLGNIAQFGNKKFIEKNWENGAVVGTFGVGFFSAFVVADSVELITRKIGSTEGIRWSWYGDNSYHIQEIAHVPTGTRIAIHLKDQNSADNFTTERIREVIMKHSKFTALPIFLNGEIVNSLNTRTIKEESQEIRDSDRREARVAAIHRVQGTNRGTSEQKGMPKQIRQRSSKNALRDSHFSV